MSENPQVHPIAKKQVLYTLPGMDAVIIRRDETYKTTDAGPLTMDVYYPPGSTPGRPLPAVVFVLGLSDIGTKQFVGCLAKEMASYVSWARLAAASGLVAITYMNREPEADALALLQHVRSNARSLGIDADRIGIWACSGHGPVAISLLMHSVHRDLPRLACAALCYPFTLDLDGSTWIAEAQKAWRFTNAAAGKSIDDFPTDVPLFIARAGRDSFAGLNDALDRLVTSAVARNLPLTFVNHPEGPHAFDLDDDSDTTRAIIRLILGFLQQHLLRS